MRRKILTVLFGLALFTLGSLLFDKSLLANGFGFFNLVVNRKYSDFIST